MTQAVDVAFKACASLGRTAAEFRYRPNELNPRFEQLKFECRSSYEIVPIDSDTLAFYPHAAKGSYKMWVPISEIPAGTSGIAQVMQRPVDYCAKMNMTMKQTGGSFNGGSGLEVIFSCVPKQQEQR